SEERRVGKECRSRWSPYHQKKRRCAWSISPSCSGGATRSCICSPSTFWRTIRATGRKRSASSSAAHSRRGCSASSRRKRRESTGRSSRASRATRAVCQCRSRIRPPRWSRCWPRRRACGTFFFQAEDGIRGRNVTGVQTCALPICRRGLPRPAPGGDQVSTNGAPDLLRLRNIDTYYGQIHILENLELNVQEGELVSLLGGNA